MKILEKSSQSGLQKRSGELLFFTANNLSYDLTWCLTNDDAKRAAREWNAIPCERQANHIALVKTDDLGKVALDEGFDSYCILDKEMHPQFFTE